MPAVPILELLIIRAKSPKILDEDKIIEVGNKYGNISNIAKKIMLIAKTNSKVYELKIYKEVITNFIHFR